MIARRRALTRPGQGRCACRPISAPSTMHAFTCPRIGWHTLTFSASAAEQRPPARCDQAYPRLSPGAHRACHRDAARRGSGGTLAERRPGTGYCAGGREPGADKGWDVAVQGAQDRKGARNHLPAFAVEELRRLKREQAEELLALGIRQSGETLVCARADGNPHQPRSLTHELTCLIRRLKDVPRVRFHALSRHSTLARWRTS